MNETLILKGLRGIETTEHTEYTERKKQEKIEWKRREILILKDLMGLETTGWLMPWWPVRARCSLLVPSCQWGATRRIPAWVLALETLGCVELFVTQGLRHEKPTHLRSMFSRSRTVLFVPMSTSATRKTV